jgi:hypothetical protein
MTSLQKKVLASYKTALVQERKHLARCAELAQSTGGDFGLKLALHRHQSNIKMYEKLIGNLQKHED